MFLKNNIINQENIPYILSFIYPLLFIWQGLDITDSGFVLSNYQLFFEDNIRFVHLFWLTNVIGGIWWNLFGNLGVIGFKLLWTLMIWICLYFAYRLLKPYSSKHLLGWALFITLLAVTNRGGNWFNYNTMTSVLYMAGAWTLMEGIRQHSRSFLIASGFLLGISVFARLPNILAISLATIIVIHGVLNDSSLRTVINKLLFFSLGVIISLSVVLIAMEWLGHRQLFIEDVQHLFSQSTDPDYHHSSNVLLYLFIKDHVFAGIFGIVGILAIVGISMLANKLFQPRSWLWWLSIFGLAGLATIAFLLWHGFWRWMVPGIIYLVLIAYIFGLIKQSLEYRILALIALGVLFLAPLGSNNGIHNAIHGMWLALPIVLLFFIQQQTTVTIRNWKCPPESFNYAKVLVIVTLILSSLAQAMSYTYRDSKNRLEMTATVEHPLLTGVLTTNERAKVMQELLDELRKYVKPGDFIFAYEEISLIYFLTQTRTYLYHTWPMLEQPANFKKLIEKAEIERPLLPVVVRAKASTSARHWPNNLDEGLEPYERETSNRQLAEVFLKRHQYVKIWENLFFEILQSRKDSQ